MSETSIAAHVSTGDKEEIEKLKAALKQSETEKDEMMVDLQLMESELKKIKIVPNQTPRFYREENSINYISDSNSSIYANANQGKDIIGASLNQSAISRMKK
jgi:Skp family chaperone for outer membrane proteins